MKVIKTKRQGALLHLPLMLILLNQGKEENNV